MKGNNEFHSGFFKKPGMINYKNWVAVNKQIPAFYIYRNTGSTGN